MHFKQICKIKSGSFCRAKRKVVHSTMAPLLLSFFLSLFLILSTHILQQTCFASENTAEQDIPNCPSSFSYHCGNLSYSTLSYPFTDAPFPTKCGHYALHCNKNNDTIVSMLALPHTTAQYQLLDIKNHTIDLYRTNVGNQHKNQDDCDFNNTYTPFLKYPSFDSSLLLSKSFKILNDEAYVRCPNGSLPTEDKKHWNCTKDTVRYGPYTLDVLRARQMVASSCYILPKINTTLSIWYDVDYQCTDCTHQGGTCYNSPGSTLTSMCLKKKEEEKTLVNKKRIIILASVSGVAIVTLLVIILIVFWHRRKMLLLGSISCYFLKRRQGSGGKGSDEKGRVKTSRTKKGGFNSLETNTDGLRAFSLCVIKESTDNFAFCNKLGHGGYGPVYKGSLKDGQVIAVKRLSGSSKQGLEEFENEVTLLARLQHVNLVRILGFCTEGGEKMLIYEYMPNGSLDSYLFDPVKRLLLDWKKRIQIVEGVIQGLLYLQEYSRLSIIHRDIKPSNVLLDIAMTPKIADFGMARIFQKNDPEANTGKIVGTYGYVPPEYATRGAYSVKLDVYSFGVLLLQMISGKTTFSSYGLTGIQALSHQAYEMWEEGKGKEFMDPTLDDTNSTCGMTTCLQVALLCVQDDPEDRPTMLEVSSMINSEIKDLPIPNIPAFSVRRGSERLTKSSQIGYTVNEATISEIIPR